MQTNTVHGNVAYSIMYAKPISVHSYKFFFCQLQLSRFTERRHLVTVRVQVAVNNDESVEWEELPSLVTSQ